MFVAFQSGGGKLACFPRRFPGPARREGWKWFLVNAEAWGTIRIVGIARFAFAVS